MNQQPLPDPHQQININDTSMQGNQVGQAGRDLTQIQGGVINVTVYDRVDVSGLLGKQVSGTVEPLTHQEYRQRKVLLNKVKKFWVEGVLEKSIHVKALIELGLEKRLDLVEQPFSEVQEIPNESIQTLSSSIDIAQVFDQMGAGRTLLILGEPGAGKTTTLLKLTQNLITSAEQDLNQLIPVVFNLSSWASKRGIIADWLVQELNSKYNVPRSQGKAWVGDEQLLLLLDGLDEVKAEYRETCVRELNRFIQEHGKTEIVVCSRIRDYEALSSHLKFQSAICIQLLTPKQVNQYLERAGDQLEAVRILLREDNTLKELANTPLILSILTIAYQGIPIQDLPKTNSLEEYRRHLFDAYIKRMFFRHKSIKQRYTEEQVKRWLIWLAQKMSQHSQAIFLIEQMQTTWLQTSFQKSIYNIVVGLLLGSVTTLVYASSSAISNSTMIVLWLLTGLASGVYARTLLIKPVEALTLKWSWKTLRANFRQESEVNVFGMLSLLYGFVSPKIKTKTFPNQGIWQSAKNAMLLTLVGVLLIVLLILLFNRWVFLGLIYNEPTINSFPAFFRCVVPLLFLGLPLGGFACIQHFILRVILCISRCIPWNYARFLEHAVDLIFLQKIGGGYIFAHRLLQEHFAMLKSY